jgi:hypothetical protein
LSAAILSISVIFNSLLTASSSLSLSGTGSSSFI